MATNKSRLLTIEIEKILKESIDRLIAENKELHRLLDLRDEQYFEFCETGIIPTNEE